ncbi:MAG: hypothetical protein RDU76_03270 [Candidatus Edwardsbacteria bacterium]|nr:hypothetical protein [Candidatus Edwardsbacteria bacterium]
MKNLKQRLVCSFIPLMVGVLVAPSVLLYVKVVYGKSGIFMAFQEIYVSQFKEGHNLFFIELTSLIPFLVLTAYLFYYTSEGSIRKAYAMCIGGIVGTLIATIIGHFSIWHSIYTNSPGSSTAVIGFLFIPIISILPMCFLGYIAYLFTRE